VCHAPACQLVQEGRDGAASDATAAACALLLPGEENAEALYARELLQQRVW